MMVVEVLGYVYNWTLDFPRNALSVQLVKLDSNILNFTATGLDPVTPPLEPRDPVKRPKFKHVLRDFCRVINLLTI